MHKAHAFGDTVKRTAAKAWKQSLVVAAGRRLEMTVVGGGEVKILGRLQPQQQQQRTHPHDHRNRTSMYHALSWSRRRSWSTRLWCLLIATRPCVWAPPPFRAPACPGQPSRHSLAPPRHSLRLWMSVVIQASSLLLPSAFPFFPPNTTHSAARPPGAGPSKIWCAKRWTTGCGP